jgi:chromosome segregation ATPase
MGTAKSRLTELHAELQAHEATGPSANDAKLTALRRKATDLEERIAGYEERSENIRRRLEKASARKSPR